jgi:hypothetical protein
VGAVLAESLRLFGSQLHLLTLLSLTVWLPAHVIIGYLDYFEKESATVDRSFRVAYLFQVVFDPLVIAATLCALSAARQGLPVSWSTAMADGARSWGRLVLVRFLILLAMMVPLAGVPLLRRPDAGSVLVGVALLAVSVLIAIALLRVAVVDAVVVLEGASVTTAWGRASALTAGRRGQILGVALVVSGLVAGSVVAVKSVVLAVPALDHFVARVLTDSALSVLQSLFTVAFFLFYLRAVTAEGPPPPPSPDPA